MLGTTGLIQFCLSSGTDNLIIIKTKVFGSILISLNCTLAYLKSDNVYGQLHEKESHDLLGK